MKLANIIFQEIEKKSQLTIAEFMELALTNSQDSYYRAKNPFSEQGDFITSPEISQMFGEMIGIWVYNQWQFLGKPSKLNLVELGPGQGILMRDIIKVIQNTDMKNCFSVFLYDVNKILIEKQRQNLSFDISINWVKCLSEIPNITSIFIANEFFDALPINQYIKDNKKWYQLVVKANSQKNKFLFDKIPTHKNINDRLNSNYKNAFDGAVLEESSVAASYLNSLASHSSSHGSVSLIIDYGYDLEPHMRTDSQFNSTLQAIKNHKYTSILNEVGKADISAHVDFNFLKQQAELLNVKASNTMYQKDFLIKLGIQFRLNKLIEANPHLKRVLDSQYHRLTSIEQMGELFKVICISKAEDIQFIFEKN